jgi:hypothetical protein
LGGLATQNHTPPHPYPGKLNSYERLIFRAGFSCANFKIIKSCDYS